MRKKSCETALRRIPEDATDEELGIYANSPIPKHSTKEEFELFRDTGMTCLVDDTSEEAMNRRAAFFLNVMLWTKEKCGEAAGKRLLEIRKNQIQSVTTARAGRAVTMQDRDNEVLSAATSILRKREQPITMNALAGKVASALEADRLADHASDDKAWTVKSVSHRLERVKASLPPGKIIPPKTRSRD